jgi:hypothetical protein
MKTLTTKLPKESKSKFQIDCEFYNPKGNYCYLTLGKCLYETKEKEGCWIYRLNKFASGDC